MMRYRTGSLVGLVLVLAAGCSGSSPLHTVDFEARTVAVVATVPGAPHLADVHFANTAWNSYGLERRVGFESSVLMKDHRKPVRALYDSAMAYVDFTERIESQVLIQTASDLGCRPIADAAAADYVFHIDLRRYGFQVNRFALTTFSLEAELRLIDNRSGKRLWKKKVQETERAADVLADLIPRHGKVFIVKDLSRLSLEEMILMLEATTDFTAERLTTALRRAVYANR